MTSTVLRVHEELIWYTSKNIPPLNFGVSDKEVALTIENMEGGKMSGSFLISNEQLYVNHFNSLFEDKLRVQ